MVKIGVFGKLEDANHLSKELIGVNELLLTGYFNPLQEEAPQSNFGKIKCFQSFDELLDSSDALYIADIACDIFEVASMAFRNTKHIFFEQISTLSLEEVESLLNNSKEANVKCVVGSNELSKAAYIFLQQHSANPSLIETQRQIELELKNQEHIVFDIIIKDIAMVLQLVKSDIKRIIVKASNVFKDSTDILNVRLEFANGCIANLMVNTSAWKSRSKLMLYETGKMVSADFIENKVKYALQHKDGSNVVESFNFDDRSTYAYQLNNFKNHILHGETSMLTLRDGYEKLSIAYKIAEKINSGTED